MKKVYICSPFRGRSAKATERNRLAALTYCRFAYEQGCNPFAPHAFYPEFLDDTDAKERKDGLRMAQEWMWAFQEVWVFGNIISPGMREEIKLAKLLEIKVRFFNEYMEEERK
jgi:hypothetical protein